MNELEKLIALSKVVAKPWVIATWVLAGLKDCSRKVLCNLCEQRQRPFAFGD